MLLLTSCGQQHQVKETIQDFIDRHAVEPESFSSIDIIKFDSTKVLQDSVIQMLRTNADTIKRYKSPIKYDDAPMGNTIFTARITYSINNKKFCDTYYLNQHLDGVIALKSN